MAKHKITRTDLERAKNPLSLLPHHVDVHEFAPIQLARDVIVRPAPTVGETAMQLLRRKPGRIKA